jgi:hypothetical protein
MVACAQQAAKQAQQALRALEQAAGQQGALPVAELVAKHARLKANLQASAAEAGHLKAALQQQAVEGGRLRAEVAVLLRALEVRTQDLGLGPSSDNGGGHQSAESMSPASRAHAVRSGLLYELAHAQQAGQNLRSAGQRQQQQWAQLQVGAAFCFSTP